jgi:hypothetical protein
MLVFRKNKLLQRLKWSLITTVCVLHDCTIIQVRLRVRFVSFNYQTDDIANEK